MHTPSSQRRSMTTTTSIPVGRAALRRTNFPSTLPINRDVSAVPIDNDPLMAGIDVPNSRTVNLIGPVSQAGNYGHRQHMVPDHAAAAVPGTISNADPRRLVLGVTDIYAAALHIEKKTITPSIARSQQNRLFLRPDEHGVCVGKTRKENIVCFQPKAPAAITRRTATATPMRRLVC